MVEESAAGHRQVMTVTMTDLFCGAGGSTTGASWVPGVEVTIAVNHWPEAIRTHAANHANVEHRVADISQLAPSSLPYTDIAWASSECTTFSQAAPARSEEAVRRSRATAFDLLRMAEHRVDQGRPYMSLIAENVIEFMNWRFFPTWVRMLAELGYDYKSVYLNSACANVGGPSAPQLRDRMYVVAWHRSIASVPDLEYWTSSRAICADCGTVNATPRTKSRPHRQGQPSRAAGRYRFQYDLACPHCHGEATPIAPTANAVIDWNDRGLLVHAPGRNLTPRTIRRIGAGIDKLGAEPAGADPRTRGFLMRNNGSRGDGREHCSSIHEPMRTLTTAGHQSLVTYPAEAVGRNRNRWARMRFLTVDEMRRGMGFPDSYRLTGTADQQRTMLGNAVTPPAARDLISCIAHAINGTTPAGRP